MAIMYVAPDGNYGDADGILFVDMGKLSPAHKSELQELFDTAGDFNQWCQDGLRDGQLIEVPTASAWNDTFGIGPYLIQSS